MPTTKEDIRLYCNRYFLYTWFLLRSRNSNLAVSFIEFLTINREIQQNLFNKGQGSSVLPEVVTSLKSEELMKKGMIGQNALTTTSLDYIMKKIQLQLFQRNKFKIIGWNRRKIRSIIYR